MHTALHTDIISKRQTRHPVASRKSRFNRSEIMRAAWAEFRVAEAGYREIVARAEAAVQASIAQDIAWGYEVTEADIARKRAFHADTIADRKPTLAAFQRAAWAAAKSPIITPDARMIAAIAAANNE